MCVCRTSSGGLLVFFDTNELSMMAKQEHPDLSDVEWDPTGRYVTSYVNLYNAKVENTLNPSKSDNFQRPV